MYKKKSIFANQKGLTLIELLIGLTLSSMVFIVASSIVISTMGYSTKNKQNQNLEQTKNDLASDLSTNIKWATRIKVEPDNNSFVLNNGVNTYEYKLNNKVITKNGSALTPTDIEISAFKINQRATSLEINIDMESKQNHNIKESLNLILSPRGKNILE
jgi:prepilin-type N-terminal cleavage/methylation domain-containing protein